MRRLTIALAVLALVLLAGCSVGDNYDCEVSYGYANDGQIIFKGNAYEKNSRVCCRVEASSQTPCRMFE